MPLIPHYDRSKLRGPVVDLDRIRSMRCPECRTLTLEPYFGVLHCKKCAKYFQDPNVCAPERPDPIPKHDDGEIVPAFVFRAEPLGPEFDIRQVMLSRRFQTDFFSWFTMIMTLGITALAWLCCLMLYVGKEIFKTDTYDWTIIGLLVLGAWALTTSAILFSVNPPDDAPDKHAVL